MRILLLLTLFLNPVSAWAASASCPGKVVQVIVEAIHNDPGSKTILPDIGTYGETPQIEWNHLNRITDAQPLVVHCYPNKRGRKFIDVDIPAGIKRCVLFEGTFSCDDAIKNEERFKQPSVSCPEKVDNVTVDVGPPGIMVVKGKEIISPSTIEQDIGGDYDENAPQLEWNELNFDQSATPVIAHCFKKVSSRESFDLVVPFEIKRCIYHDQNFTCQSGTVACNGYVDQVSIEEDTTPLEPSRVIDPDIIKNGISIWHIEQSVENTSVSRHLTASCFTSYFPNYAEKIQIPEDMKECQLSNNRFICSADPTRHDLFWPEADGLRVDKQSE